MKSFTHGLIIVELYSGVNVANVRRNDYGRQKQQQPGTATRSR